MSTKMGRPIKSDAPKQERIGIRLTTEEKQKIVSSAEKEKKSCSDFILDAVWEHIRNMG